MADALKSSLGRVWIQPGGPNKPVYLLSCTELGDLTEAFGKINLIRCRNADNKFVTVGSTQDAPDPVSTSITQLVFAERSWLEKLGACSFGVYALMRDGGKADVFANYVRGQMMANARMTQRAYSNLAQREEDNGAEVAVDIEAWPPLFDIDEPEATLQPDTTDADPLNAVAVNTDVRCEGELGLPALEAAHFVVTVGVADAGVAADVWIDPTDGGNSFAAAAAQPFAADKDIMGVVIFYVGRNTRRILVAKKGGAAEQGQVAYSDDLGVSWAVVSVGGAAEGRGPVYGEGLFAIDWRHIYNAGDDGYIYKSEDGGETWTAVEAGSIMANDYRCIHFIDEEYGIAAGTGGVVALSNDGGDTWVAATIPEASDINTCVRLSKNRLWVGNAAGKLWYSEDEGVTWTQRSGWVGSGSGQVRSLKFANDYFGMMVHDTAGPVATILRTFDGGYDWEELTTPSNAGGNHLAMGDYSTAVMVGEANGGASVVIRVERA